MDKVKAFLKSKAGLAVVAAILGAAYVYSAELGDTIKALVEAVTASGVAQ